MKQHACIAYALKSSLYIAVTNVANTVTLPASRGPGFQMPKVFQPLPDGYEPTAAEVIAAVSKELARPTFAPPGGAYTGLVFAGLGEPTMRWRTVCETARALRRAHPSLPQRLTTNGIGTLAPGAELQLNVEDLAREAAALPLDGVAVALNTASAAQYDASMRPRLVSTLPGAAAAAAAAAGAALSAPPSPLPSASTVPLSPSAAAAAVAAAAAPLRAHEEVCRFVAACSAVGLATECTIVEAPGVDVAAATALAQLLGAGVRLRSYHP